MKIQVENLITHESDIYDVAQIPCIGEKVGLIEEEDLYEVKAVFHMLNANPETQIAAIVRVA